MTLLTDMGCNRRCITSSDDVPCPLDCKIATAVVPWMIILGVLLSFLLCVQRGVGEEQLFAVLGAEGCAESLPYGSQPVSKAGSEDGRYDLYLSIGLESDDTVHDSWTQIVTSNGENEIFRILWAFSSLKTLSERFTSAAAAGEPVTYRVIDASTGNEHTYTGMWWFSSASQLSAAQFDAASDGCCFSASGGVWGAGNGTIDGSDDSLTSPARSFWGIGAWGGEGDVGCASVYKNGVKLTEYGTDARTFLYYSMGVAPSAEPTADPTLAPNASPTAAPTPQPSPHPTPEPTRVPTSSPSTTLPTAMPSYSASLGGSHLFAVLGGKECAEELYYGPQAITTAGSADGWHKHFLSTSTAAKDIPHDTWEQVVTTDGTTERFHISWRFSNQKTLAQRISDAVVYGEQVNYTVTFGIWGDTHTYSGVWRFSSAAGAVFSKFNTPSTVCCFSDDSGVWGAGSGVLDPKGDPYYGTKFWGVGNWGGLDRNACPKIYENGVALSSFGANTRTLMYYVVNLDPTAAPTAAPSTPSCAPTTAPTLVPSAKPSSAQPSLTPTLDPTPPATFPPNAGVDQLFAVIGGTECAEDLAYGPSVITTAGTVDGQYPFYLSTATPGRDVTHRFWTQVVTIDGVTEWFRIYWTFDTPRTLAQHFVAATSQGVKVSYRVVTAEGVEYTFTDSTWWFSSAAQTTQAKFDTPTTSFRFSADDGVWGAGSGIIQPNGDPDGYSRASFWGVGNWNDGDITQCDKIFIDGRDYIFGVGTPKTYMYYSHVDDPTAVPTATPSEPSYAPSAQPSLVPTAKPTTAAPTPSPSRVPTAAATFPPNLGPDLLFAIVGGTHCATHLHYGPEAITTAGTVDGQYPFYLSTAMPGRDVPHRYWTQVVTTDGTTEVFRIFWTFDTPRTLAQHFVAATSQGVKVSYRVVTAAGVEYSYPDSTWWFSNGAPITLAQFETPSTTPGFCAFSAAWGGGSGVISPTDHSGYTSGDFWGVGNRGGYYDSEECSKIYQQGSIHYTHWLQPSKTYMYYSVDDVSNRPPTATPTRAPTHTRRPTSKPTPTPPSATPTATPTLGGRSTAHMDVEQGISGVGWLNYTAAPEAFNAAIIESIVQSIAGITTTAVTNFRVSPGSDRRKLRGAGAFVSAARDAETGRQVGSVERSVRAAADLVAHVDLTPELRDPPTSSGGGTAVFSGGSGLSSYGESLLVTYSIVLTNPTYTYWILQDLLMASVQSGYFDEVLQSQAAVYNLPALSGATTSTLLLDGPAIPASDDASGGGALPLGAVVGIAVGGGAVAVLLLAAVYVCWCRVGAASVAELPVQQQPLDLATYTDHDPSMAKDIHMYFYGTGVPQGGSTGSGGGSGGTAPSYQALIPAALSESMDFAIGAGNQAECNPADASAVVAYDDASLGAAGHEADLGATCLAPPSPRPAERHVAAPPQPAPVV